MSEAQEAHAHSGHPPAEEDVLPSMKIVMVGVVAGVVAMTMAARRILIQIPQRTWRRS